jgi:hypothetical protein
LALPRTAAERRAAQLTTRFTTMAKMSARRGYYNNMAAYTGRWEVEMCDAPCAQPGVYVPSRPTGQPLLFPPHSSRTHACVPRVACCGVPRDGSGTLQTLGWGAARLWPRSLLVPPSRP